MIITITLRFGLSLILIIFKTNGYWYMTCEKAGRLKSQVESMDRIELTHSLLNVLNIPTGTLPIHNLFQIIYFYSC